MQLPLTILGFFALFLAACAPSPDSGLDGDRPAALLEGGPAAGVIAVTHGGVGSPPTWSGDVQVAADTARRKTLDTGDALDSALDSALEGAIAGTVVLENNPLLNAGTGANIRLDGCTIQMDAALMTSDGRFAAVAVIEHVANPIRVVRAVLDTPHRMLAGDGATRFAHAMGFKDVVPTCEQSEAKYRQRIVNLLHGEAGGGYDTFDWRKAWNFPGPPPSLPDEEPPVPEQDDRLRMKDATDTVGTVVRAADGSFAVTLSTGGTSITLDGRVGDVPIYGCGCYAGPAGAVACTGHGEEIIRAAMARTIYDLMADGVSAREAVRRGVASFPEDWSLGLIAVDRTGWGVAATHQMAYGAAVD